MEERNDYLEKFAVDKKETLCSQNITVQAMRIFASALLVVKKAMEDTFSYSEIRLDNIYLDELRIKVDNHNDRYYLNAFYYKQKRDRSTACISV